jgi:guanine deaminase
MGNFNIEFLKEAIELSRENLTEFAGGPFGAVIVKDGKIIGEGKNEVLKNNDPTAHAEVLAIRDACKHTNSYVLTGCEIYTSCEPCPMCLASIYWARIEKIYYANTRCDAAEIGFDDEMFYKELTLDMSERKVKMEQHFSEEAKKIFEEYIEKGGNLY